MEEKEWSQKLLVLLGPSILVIVVFLLVEWRTDATIERMADVCEQAGMGLEIQKINFWGGVEARCMPRADG
ncbi:MAG: hypothetical protein CMP07_13745 [Xanthomonadales bacterium]|nr:hypothetical protein [Xanthomonadales bacterium]|tara:strand:- start:142 stop:354 length:213 start_codon:yes stop_codon:yes gene_type:complete